jgi:hypothetical protein
VKCTSHCGRRLLATKGANLLVFWPPWSSASRSPARTVAHGRPGQIFSSSLRFKDSTFEERLWHSQGANFNADTSNANKIRLKACTRTCARGFGNAALNGFPERRNVGPTIQSVASVSIENRLKESSHREKALNVSFVDPFALSPNVSLELQWPHDRAPVGSPRLRQVSRMVAMR